MKVLIVYAHPDPKSMTGSLKDLAVETLREQGHEVVLSDLYAMKWQAAADFTDFDEVDGTDFMTASGIAYNSDRLSQDIRAEQRKLLEADLVILQFPLWWFSMPAILKGWIDRVFTRDFAYGKMPRYGNGPFEGKRALVATVTGGAARHYGERGVNGHIDDLLHHLQHGTLFFTGFAVLPPFVAHGVVHVDDDRFADIADGYRRRLTDIDSTEPIPYRAEAGGDYDDDNQLKPGVEASGTTGLALHLKTIG